MLRERANEPAAQLDAAEHGEDSRADAETIYTALKEMSLQSWKNGLAAGRARPRKQAIQATERA